MRHAHGRIAAALIIAVWLTAGCERFAGTPQPARFEDLGSSRVGIISSPDPPTTGENVMTVVVKDAGGRPVRGATLDIMVSMPAMGAMPRMESRGKVREVRAGVYRAAYGLSMAGDWEVNVRVGSAGVEAATGNWHLSTTRKGMEFVDGSAPAEGRGAASGDSALRASASPMAVAGELPGAIRLDAARRQSLGVTVEPVMMRDLVVEIRAAGRVAYDETRMVQVSPRVSGWVRAIHADFTGAPVRSGEPLFEIYSPELWAAQQEFIEALRAAREDSARGGGGADLAEAARKRLTLWDLNAADIDAIARSGRPRETVPVRSPVTGVVTEKTIVLGSPVSAGQVLYSIASTDPVWVLASVVEQDLPLVRVGQSVRLSQPGGTGRDRAGRVAFVAPDLAPDTRTGTLRVSAANADGLLKPGMYVDVRLSVPLGPRLAIPDGAVLPTGERHIVFVDLGDGRLAPRDVRLGAKAGGYTAVLGGLARGERIVTSGNFLVAAESRLRSATGTW